MGFSRQEYWSGVPLPLRDIKMCCLKCPVAEGEGGTNSEGSTNADTLPCVKETASRRLLYHTGGSARCSDDLEEWGGGDAGGRLQREGIHVPI